MSTECIDIIGLPIVGALRRCLWRWIGLCGGGSTGGDTEEDSNNGEGTQTETHDDEVGVEEVALVVVVAAAVEATTAVVVLLGVKVSLMRFKGGEVELQSFSLVSNAMLRDWTARNCFKFPVFDRVIFGSPKNKLSVILSCCYRCCSLVRIPKMLFILIDLQTAINETTFHLNKLRIPMELNLYFMIVLAMSEILGWGLQSGSLPINRQNSNQLMFL